MFSKGVVQPTWSELFLQSLPAGLFPGKPQFGAEAARSHPRVNWLLAVRGHRGRVGLSLGHPGAEAPAAVVSTASSSFKAWANGKVSPGALQTSLQGFNLALGL